MDIRRSYSTIIFMLFLIWLNTRSPETPDVDIEDGFSQAITTLNRTVTTSPYPQNISDWYLGMTQTAIEGK
jgi:hypothetical protein